MLLAFMPAKAQIQNKESLYIGDAGYVYLTSGIYYFGNGGQTQTSRTLANYGKLIFTAGTSSSGASNSHYVDGYVQYLGTAPFLFPIGQSSIYAPVQVIPNSAIGVDAAYYRSNTNIVGAILDASVSSISSTEYWDIKGATSAQITLTWRASSLVSELATTTADLTIVGFDGIKWIQIESSVDTTSILGSTSSLLNGGSITTNYNVDLGSFTAFSIGSKGNACAPLITSSGIAKTWNGSSWSPSMPTLSDTAIINGNYSGNLSCNSLVLNADITVANGQFVEIVNGASGSGKIILASEASLVQRNGSATAPNVELNKLSRPMKRYDYIYWGTPIAGNFISQLNEAKALTATLSAPFDLKYGYTTGTGGGWTTLTAINTGLGFITRVKNQVPFIDAVTLDNIGMKFTGTANNGDVSVNVTNNPALPNGGTSFALLANPYPSAVDAAKFLSENTNLDGTLYFWTAATPPASVTGVYTQADYAAWNLSGMVNPSPIGLDFNGKIASAQGFRIKVLTNSTATFTNCMRVTSGNDVFYKNANQSSVATKNKYKVNMIGNNGVFSQILVAYIPDASFGYDRLYDAPRNSVSTAKFYSLIDGKEMAINGRPTFENTDIVPVGISKSTTTAEPFTFSIQDTEGIFANGTTVFLHDILMNTFHDLTTGSYTAIIDTTTVTNRFELVYLNPFLSNTAFQSFNALAMLHNNTLTVSASDSIASVAVFDMTGRLVEHFNADSKEVVKPFFHSEGIYIVKIKTTNGLLETKKLINSSEK